MARRIIANNILFAQAAEQVAAGRRVEVPTKGASMLPFIVGGKDSIVLSSPADIVVGDIVLAHINDKHYVAHRIIAIEEGRITLMGDGNVAGVEHCTHQQVVAKVESIIHHGRRINPSSPRSRRLSRLWQRLLPLRRYILGIWRRTPFWPMK